MVSPIADDEPDPLHRNGLSVRDQPTTPAANSAASPKQASATSVIVMTISWIDSGYATMTKVTQMTLGESKRAGPSFGGRAESRDGAAGTQRAMRIGATFSKALRSARFVSGRSASRPSRSA